MRNVIFALNVTLDGCCDHTKVTGSADIHEYFTNLMNDVDLLVFGRKTYELMVPFWPDVAKSLSQTKSMNEFALKFDSIDKLVFSRSLERAEGKTRIVRAGVRDEILKLKQQPGKNILVGGVTVPSQLLELGLLDEFHLIVHPVVAGEGRRLFSDVHLADRVEAKLVESKILKSGCVVLRYSKEPSN